MNTFFRTTLLVGALLYFGPSAQCTPHSNKVLETGYKLTPLENYIIEAFAFEQLEAFVNTGSSSLFENPKVYYLRAGTLGEEAGKNLGKARETYLNQFIVVSAVPTQAVNSGKEFIAKIKRPATTASLSMGEDSDPKLVQSVRIGKRTSFYCKLKELELGSMNFVGCLPIEQYQQKKTKEIETGIHNFLAGKKDASPNMPTYAMLAYMSVVSARLLPEKSVCRQTVAENAKSSSAEMRQCGQEVFDLWQSAGMNPNFEKTMDEVQDQLKQSGVDVGLITQATTSMD